MFKTVQTQFRSIQTTLAVGIDIRTGQ